MSINLLLQDGDTALLLACTEDKVDVVKVLVQAGADKNIQNKVRKVCIYVCLNTICCCSAVFVTYICMILSIQKGETALSVAKTEEIKKILVEYGECSILIIPILYVTVWYMCYRPERQ